QKLPARNFRVAAQRSSFGETPWLQPGKNRPAPPMSLTCVGESFRVHVLVEHAQRNEIALVLGQVSLVDAFQNAVAHGRHVRKRIRSGRERQVPSSIMCDGSGIVE